VSIAADGGDFNPTYYGCSSLKMAESGYPIIPASRADADCHVVATLHATQPMRETNRISCNYQYKLSKWKLKSLINPPCKEHHL